MSGNVRIWWDTSVSAYRLTSSFNAELVTALKAFIPVSDRSYDPATKVWTLTEKYFDPVKQLCNKLQMQITAVTRQQAETAQQGSPKTTAIAPLDTALADFMRLLPFEAAQSAYRKAAMLLHPDRGGSMESMSKLNILWNRLEKELYAGR